MSKASAHEKPMESEARVKRQSWDEISSWAIWTLLKLYTKKKF